MKPDATMLKTGPAGTTIDLLRGGLAIMVLVAHALESTLLLVKVSALPNWMAVTLGHGGFWVNGFFVLSGFCIHRSIMAQRIQDTRPWAVSYAMARLTRLYPLYLIALVLALMISGWPGGGSLISHLLMMQGITGTLPAIKPAWSLTYEILYYAAWPVVLFASGWQMRKALLRAGAGTVIFAATLMLIWKKGMGSADGPWVLPLALIAAQFPLWLGGAWLAQSWESVLKHARRWMAPVALLWIMLGYLVQAFMLHRHASTSVIIALGWLVLPGWLGLVLGSAAWSGLVRWSAAARWLGWLSYPLYILHQPLLDILVAGGRAWQLQADLGQTVILLLAWVMACMIVAGVPLEAGLLRWRSRWLGGKRDRELKAVTS